MDAKQDLQLSRTLLTSKKVPSHFCKQFEQRPNFASTFKLDGTIRYPWLCRASKNLKMLRRTFQLIFYAAPIVADELFSRSHGRSKIIVISPLRTLMEDQVAHLRSLGLSAIALHYEQSEERLKEVENGAFTYLFVSPEKMLSVERWRKLLLT